MAFLGIRVPEQTGRLLTGIDVPGEKESSSEYHITILCFEDNWPITEVAKALEASYDVISKFEPFLVKTDTITSFPKREDKPLPIIAKVESKELHQLSDKLRDKFDKEKIDYSKIFKDFKPHITLAYDSENDDLKEFKIDPVEFIVQDLVLWGGDYGDSRLFVNFQLKGPEAHKRSSLFQKIELFYKLAHSDPQGYLTPTHERRKIER